MTAPHATMVPVTRLQGDPTGAVSEPFRWVSPREIIEGDDGPELDGVRAPFLDLLGLHQPPRRPGSRRSSPRTAARTQI